MTNISSDYGVSNAFLDHLDQLIGQPGGGWWRDVLSRDDLFLAVRRNSLNVYYRGASLFRIDDKRDGTASPKTHVKYLVRQQQKLVELVDGEFKSNGEIIWTHYDKDKTLRDMIHSAADLAGLEKTGLHSLILNASHVIDVEISLERAGEADPVELGSAADDHDESGNIKSENRNQDRLDVATLEPLGDAIAVVFHEAKHFTNSALRAKRNEPKVVSQLRRYRRTIARETPSLLERYHATCRGLVRIHAMRQRADSAKATRELNQLIQDVAAGARRLIIDPNPRLLIFGFDADQKNGALKSILDALDRPELSIYAVGDPKSATGAFRSPVPVTSDKNITSNFLS